MGCSLNDIHNIFECFNVESNSEKSSREKFQAESRKLIDGGWYSSDVS